MSHITETARGGTSSWFIQKRRWEKSISFLSLSLMSLPVILSDVSVSFPLCFSLCLCVSASVALSLCLFFLLKTVSLIISPTNSLFLPHLCLYTSLSSLALFPHLYSTSCLFSFPPSRCPCRGVSWSPPLFCPPPYFPVGYNSWQPLVSGWPLTVCMKISAGDPIKTRRALLPYLQEKLIYPSPPGVSKILFCPCRYPGTLLHPDLLDSKWTLCDRNKHYSFTYLLCSRPCAAYLL